MRNAARRRVISPWLLLIIASLIAAAGVFGPWTPHPAAGLVITGVDLGEYVKFLPEVASGQIPIRRELFYLPLVAASVSASLLASRRALPMWARAVLAMCAAPLALAMLPPAWSPAVLRLPEFRVQVIAILGCLALLPALVVTRFLPDRLVLGIIALLALAAAVAPAWSFLQVQPLIAALYRRPLPLGWGFWASLVGNLALATIALAPGPAPGRAMRSSAAAGMGAPGPAPGRAERCTGTLTT